MTISFHKMSCFLMGVGLIFAVSACSDAPSKDQGKKNDPMNHETVDHSKMDHSKMVMDAVEPTDMSIYNLESTWTDQDAKPLQLKELGGRVQVLAMVYSSCQNACPRIIADMKRIETAVDQKYKGRVQLILVSIDPEVDTPEKLKALAEKSHLNKNWHLLRGAPDDVLELAALLGVKYKKISDTDYAHSNIISVLNAQGEIKHQQIGLGVEPEETLKAISNLLAS